MKQIIKRSALLIVMTGAIIFYSCKKDKDDSTPAKTKTELITTGSWKLTAFTVNPARDIDGDGTAETDVYSKAPACVKDNFTIFKTNSEGEDNEGATKCNSADPQIKQWSWNFNSDETHLLFDGFDYTIADLTASTLKLTDIYFDANTFTLYTYQITYGH